jgi:predicted  nucleic acid-binding Zn-ribbon protein
MLQLGRVFETTPGCVGTGRLRPCAIDWASHPRGPPLIEGLQQLIELQKVDDELLAVEQEHAGLPARRQELVDRREAVEAQSEASRQALQEVEGAQRRSETEAQDKAALKDKLESQQFQVKSNDAYTTLLREIEQAKEAISEAETRVLESMEAIDAARERLAESEGAAKATLASVDEQGRGFDEREKVLDGLISKLRGDREAICSSLSPELLAQYHRIISRRRPAIAQVRDEMCLGCRINIPPQQHIELLRGEVLITCFRCHRILIPPNAVGAAN